MLVINHLEIIFVFRKSQFSLLEKAFCVSSMTGFVAWCIYFYDDDDDALVGSEARVEKTFM